MTVAPYVRSCITLILVFLLACSPASSSDVYLHGKMAWWQQVLGFWGCDVKIEGMPGIPKQEGFVLAQGTVAADNVFRWHAVGRSIQADQYDGFSTTAESWWESQADSSGYAATFRSPNGHVFEKLPGTSSIDSHDPVNRAILRETYALRDDVFYQRTDRLERGQWILFSKSSCSRHP